MHVCSDSRYSQEVNKHGGQSKHGCEKKFQNLINGGGVKIEGGSECEEALKMSI